MPEENVGKKIGLKKQKTAREWMKDAGLVKLAEEELRYRNTVGKSKSAIRKIKHRIKKSLLGLCRECYEPTARHSKSYCEECLRVCSGKEKIKRLSRRKDRICKTCKNELNEIDTSIHECSTCLQRNILLRRMRT